MVRRSTPRTWALRVCLVGGCANTIGSPPAEPVAASTPVPDACLSTVGDGHDDRAGFRAIALRRFEDHVDRERGVIFVDAWEDDSEEPRPKIATVVCRDELGPLLADWTEDLAHRLVDLEQTFTCGCDGCVHEAVEGMDFRGEYRFDGGDLRIVAHTSGPPGHIMEARLSMDRRFVAAAVDALAEAPCGTRYADYPEYDPDLDGPAE